MQSGAQGLKKLTTGIQKVLPDQARGHLYLKTDRAPWTLLWSSKPDNSEGKPDVTRLLRACEKRQRTVVVYEAQNDPLLRGVDPRAFQSALCAPVHDETRNLIGLLLLQSSLPRAFEPGDRFRWEQHARDLGQVLPEHRLTVDSSSETEPASSYDFLLNGTSLGVFGLVALLGGLWLLSPSGSNTPPPPPAQVANDTRAVSEDAELFRKTLEAGDFEKAWTLLDPDLQMRWRSGDFVSRMREQAQTLQGRSLSRVQRTGSEAVVHLNAPAGGGSVKWTWTLRQRAKGWRVAELQGGPVESPER